MTSRRNQPRLNYKLFNSTGERSDASQPTINTDFVEELHDVSSQLNQLSIADMPVTSNLMNETTIDLEEIQDYIDENPIHPDYAANFNNVIEKLGELRLSLRRKDMQLKADDNHELSERIVETLANIKDYIKNAKDCKVKTELAQNKQATNITTFKERSTLFAIDDIKFVINELQKDFDKSITDMTNAELIQSKKDLPTKIDQIHKISQKYETILQTPITKSEILMGVQEIGKKYEHLLHSKSTFTELLNAAIIEQDVYKQQLFNESKLNIRLEKFSGHNDSIDFYTFKSDFNKLHERSTPKHLLPDLLKNNFLKEPAFSLVKSLTDLDEIWKQLKFAYGDVKVLLTKRLEQFGKLDSLSKLKDPESLAHMISKIVNLLKDVMLLAEKHNIEHHLYYGESIQRIYNLLDDSRLSRWLRNIPVDDNFPKNTWTKFVEFLEQEQKLQQQKVLIRGASHGVSSKNKLSDSKSNKHRTESSIHHSSINRSDPTCFVCNSQDGENDHVATSGPAGTKIIQYHTCINFVEMTPAKRMAFLKDKGYCYQCLYPGANISFSKHKEGRCQHEFVCPHVSHNSYPVRKHVLVCEQHKDDEDNKQLLEKYKQRCLRNYKLPSFAKNISLSFHTNNSFNSQAGTSYKSTDEQGIYLLQTIKINNNDFTIFYDNGCSDFIVKQSAITMLGDAASKESSNIIQIGGVGNTTTSSKLGSYNVKIPTHNGQIASLSGICMEQITQTFPRYPLQEVSSDIRQHHQSIGCRSILPTTSTHVGGDVHFMIGVKYLRYHPRMIHQLPSGLAIYESIFNNSDCGRGVIGGPHPVFTKIHEKFFNSRSASTEFVSNQYKLYKMGIQVNPDASLLAFASNIQKRFEASESTGSEITYRCVTCRSCKNCKNATHLQEISIKEEVEQNLIDSSININLQTEEITATLPFIDQTSKLAPNKNIALNIYYQQLKKLDQHPDDKADIIASEAKLQKLGFVEYVENLSPEIQSALKNSPSQNFIPWRAVWKASSVSTPCRVVFDASHPTASGYSLNDLLAKGQNNLNKLQEILIRWSIRKVGIHSDIRKMYNTIKLEEKDWCFQRYVWQSELDRSKMPKEKVIKTLIYGVRSSGNQAECGLREVANIFKEEYPEIHEIIHNDIYVDDCLTGESETNTAYMRADDLQLIINRGGFKLKGVTFSGAHPPPDLSDDGISIAVGGMKWYPKEDELSLNINDLNFSKKKRGKKLPEAVNIIPERLTRRHCASKVAEIYDLTGRIAPLIASLKLDLHDLTLRQLDWDDTIPHELRSTWINNFELMKELGNIRFQRAVVPKDAANLDIQTLDFGDASKSLICVCIYARFLRRNGNYSCRLVFARTRIVPKDLSLPRAELMAALINTHSGEVVRRSFGRFHKSSLKFTDSQIALHWVTNDEKPLKQWVRNRVIDINRFTNKDQWKYIHTNNMIADLGTRRGSTFKDIDQHSPWINGFPWMSQDITNFPMESAQELRLSHNQISEVEKERNVQIYHALQNQKTSIEPVRQRYQFSQYLIDPNRHRFSMVVRIMSYVIRFCSNLATRILKKNNPHRSSHVISTDEINAAEKYFYGKGTAEVIRFLPKSKYEKISTEKDGLLLYTGRILPESQVTIVGKFTNVMKDLSSDTFLVPVLDRNSPLAYSIATEVHWYHPTARHCGIETTLRYVLKKCHIIEGRILMKIIKKSCHRCRYLSKRTIEMAMGPVSRFNMTIAPAFYYTQLDLSGPYLSYSPQHKRTTVKIWLVVFCCCSTCAVKIKVMDDYSTTGFIQAVTRFAADHGFPKRIICDEGSQLVKGCKEMKIDTINVQHQLSRESRIDFQTCPVQGHNMNGKVERKIREIKTSLEKSLNNQRLSILQWETLSSVIANRINNLPLAIGDVIGDFECMDLITPNRLMLGRNNEHALDGLVLCDNPTKLIKENEKLFNAWFEMWLVVHVPKLMKHQKWFESDTLAVGDIVLFTKVDSLLKDRYTYGMVVDLDYGSDLLPRRAKVRYRNENENVSRETNRSVRGLVKIIQADESDLMTELGVMAKDIDLKSNC